MFLWDREKFKHVIYDFRDVEVATASKKVLKISYK